MRMYGRWTYLPVLLLLLAGFAMADPINEVVNGSFEQPISGRLEAFNAWGLGPAIPGWTIGYGSIYIADNTLWQASDGKQSLQVNGSDPGTIYQDIQTLAGANYDLSFDLSANPAGRDNGYGTLYSVLVTFGGISQTYTFDASSNTFANMGYIHQVFPTITGTGGLVRLQFQGTSPGWAAAIVDNVTVYDPPGPRAPASVPEPASLFLLGSGLAAMFGLRKKSR